jgi:hypothetical protein
MTDLKLTKTRMREGVWEGIVTHKAGKTPQIEVTHAGTPLQDVTLTKNESAGHWLLSITVPMEAIADGVQILLITDTSTDQRIGHVSLIADEVMTDNLLGEVELLRAELDMLKRAFRRHCLETA